MATIQHFLSSSLFLSKRYTQNGINTILIMESKPRNSRKWINKYKWISIWVEKKVIKKKKKQPFYKLANCYCFFKSYHSIRISFAVMLYLVVFLFFFQIISQFIKLSLKRFLFEWSKSEMKNGSVPSPIGNRTAIWISFVFFAWFCE